MFNYKRFVRTKTAVSNNFIQSQGNKIIYGIGQGNVGGTTMWINYLVAMLQILETIFERMVLYNPKGEK